MLRLLPTPKLCFEENEKIALKNAIYTEKDEWIRFSKRFAQDFANINDTELSFEQGGIYLICDTALEEGQYIIECKEQVTVRASSDEGVLYALSSLLQIIECDNGDLICPKLYIEDVPDKEYRAIMIDLGREWHPFDKLLKYIDVCYMYKIKYLHLHFADSRLYTLPSRAFPKLCREGRCYTEEQLGDLREYAKLRGVILVPEFECPGHAPVLVETYPEVFANKFTDEVGAVHYDEHGMPIPVNQLLCAGSEVCFEAIKTLLREICELFPDAPYINIGGDEAGVALWAKCSECKKYMEEHGIADEHELYAEYLERVTKYVISLGKIPMVWEGFSAKEAERIPKETIVIAWEAVNILPEELLSAGFKIINTSWQPLYIVNNPHLRWGPDEIMNWNVYNWQHWAKKSKATLNPINIQPTERVMGAMMCSWQQTYEQEINYIMENLAALSERTWNEKRVCDNAEFKLKLHNVYNKTARIIQDR